MGFNSVYRVLQNVFPEVDSRILRAVAIENSEDVDIAMRVVLAEIIPHLSEQSLTVPSSKKGKSSVALSEDGESDTDSECEDNINITQDSDLSISSKTTSEEEREDESIMTSTLTRSDQNYSTELLEDIIENARNSKKTMVLTMDSVVNLMKVVEFKEKTAEHAKEEATQGCSDILAKVDELKEALRHAKEANDMHAGEVYAEKAILSAEMKELQLRLFAMSEESNKSLEILDEMRRALEVRLATALKEIKAAEEEKTENERSARGALEYQESQMEKVVEESKKLKLEAEENAKLQEFLMDRGRAIDALQGEMSVKCEDVRLLKEKFDKRNSVSFSHTSSNLASSSSSFRSSVTPSEPEPETYGTQKTRPELADSNGFFKKRSKSLAETVYSIDDRFSSTEEKRDDDGCKLHLHVGWELFEEAFINL